MNASQQGSNVDPLDYYPLVARVAGQLVTRLPCSIERAELINVGFIGLLESGRRFNPALGVAFSAYAELRIRGAMIDFLRKFDWVPRNVRRRAEHLEKTKHLLFQRMGVFPSDKDIAEQMGISLSDFAKYCRDSEIVSVHPFGELAEDGMTLYETISSDIKTIEQELQVRELHALLHREIDKLPKRAKETIRLYYFHHQNLKQIGQQLGVSESRVCQIRNGAMVHLRKRIRYAFCLSM